MPGVSRFTCRTRGAFMSKNKSLRSFLRAAPPPDPAIEHTDDMRDIGNGVFTSVPGAAPVGVGDVLPGEVHDVRGVDVGLWSSMPADAPGWKPEQVHLILRVGGGDLVLRLKSKAAAEKVVGALVRSCRTAFEGFDPEALSRAAGDPV